jgi:hypothetical protein
MSKMACLCGAVISDALVPCPTEAWLVRDQDADDYRAAACHDVAAFFAAVAAGQRAAWISEFFSAQYSLDVSDEEVIQDVLCVHERGFFLSVAECAQCGRLWVQRAPGVNAYRSFTPDEPGYAGALRARRQETE